MARIAVVGSGAWGTALAFSLYRSGHRDLCLWSHSDSVAETIRNTRENSRFLPGFHLPDHIGITSSLETAVSDADVLVTVTPSHHVRQVYGEILPFLRPEHILVSATKGIESGTGMRVSQVIADVLRPASRSNEVSVLSGPSFAQEVAGGSPSAVVLAVPPSFADRQAELQKLFLNDALRVYTTGDVAGVEIGGSIKNVIAIASGIVAGLELGANTAAALITRGLAEITRLAVACGGRPETLAGLAGMGDLVLTATGSLSRNRSVGFALGRGQKLPEVLAAMGGKVAEGVETTRAALELAAISGVELPITEQVAEILYRGKEPRRAIHDLMRRPGRGE